MSTIKPMYRIGDKVTIRSDLEENKTYGGTNFNSHMYKNMGRSYYVERVIVNGHKSTGGRIQEGYVLRNVGYTYTKKMFVQTDVEQFEVGMEVEIVDADVTGMYKPYNYKEFLGKQGIIEEKYCERGFWQYKVRLKNDNTIFFVKEMLKEVDQEQWVVTWKQEVVGKAFVVVKSRRTVCKNAREAEIIINALMQIKGATNIKSEILNKEV